MKHLLFLLLFTPSLFSFYVTNELPKETTQLIESFECFNKNDKTVLYTYLLALKYRMEHVDDKDALVKSDLDYWRMWHLVSDIEGACLLDYKFDDIMEETLTPTRSLKETLKKLRRVESAIHTDGSSETSAKMRQYDADLQKAILSSPPEFRIMDKNASLPDYDLTTLKKYPPQSIPKKIYDAIKAANLDEHRKELLIRDAYLGEEMIRKYDQPEARHTIKQEMLYLRACKNYYRINRAVIRSDFKQNHKRQLSIRSTIGAHYYPLQEEFLPKELEAYCEHNITKTKVVTYVPAKDSVAKAAENKIVFPKSRTYLAAYKGALSKKHKMETYLEIVTRNMEGKGVNLGTGLQLVRLSNCFEKEDAEFIKQIIQDAKDQHLEEAFTEKVLQPQLWWTMTIGMKIEQEGKSKELEHFFDCNQTASPSFVLTAQHTSGQEDKPRFSTQDMHKGSSMTGSILKYYAATFENRPTPDMDNEKAIEAGLVSRDMLDDAGKIKVPFGDEFLIKGMPEGGISLTYYGVPKGKLCSDFITFGSSNNTLNFNGKTFEGIDYILLNGQKIKIKKQQYYVGKHVQRLCSKSDDNTVSFVKEHPVKPYNFGVIYPIDIIFEKVEKAESFDNNRYSPYSFAHHRGSRTFVVIGSEAKRYDIDLYSGNAIARPLPRDFANSYDIALSPSGKVLAVQRYDTQIYLWDMRRNERIKKINLEKKNSGNIRMFLPDNETLVFVGDEVRLFNTKTGETVGKILPRFMQNKRSFGRPRITALAVSPDGDTLFIGGNRSVIERWNIGKGFFGSRPLNYLDTIEDKEIREIGALVFDQNNPDILIVGSRGNKINFWNVQQQKMVRSLTADEYMNCQDIQISDDHKYLLAVGTFGVYLWKLDNPEPYDIVKGDKIVGAMFIPGTSQFITMDKDVSVWEIKAR